MDSKQQSTSNKASVSGGSGSGGGGSKLGSDNPRFPLTSGQLNEINSIIGNALREDLGGYGSVGDVTTLSTVGESVTATARFLAKADGIVAGICVAQRVFDMVDKSLITDWSKSDGDSVKSGEHFGSVSGNARSIIIAERLALNILQRMSGVATATRRMCDAVTASTHPTTKILDTRKTLPGLRVLEKLAVVMGGGTNHRYGLFDMVMIKDNHVTASGGIQSAITNVHSFLTKHHSHSLTAGSAGRVSASIPIEVETRTLDEVKQALSVGGVDRIMLDNMVRVDSQNGKIDCSMLQKAVALIQAHNNKLPPESAATPATTTATADTKSGFTFKPKRVETEASGNVTLQTVAAIAETGVDFISSGSLTHSAIALDISLKIATADVPKTGH